MKQLTVMKKKKRNEKAKNPCIKSTYIKSNQIKSSGNLYITTINILTINRSTKWRKAESKPKTIYGIYKPYTSSHVSFKRSLERRNVSDSLAFGGNALQSLLARNVKDRCINSRLKGGKFRLVLSPRKLYGTSLKLKKNTAAL